MKFSKEGLLTITGLLVIWGVTLMTTTSAKDLKIDLTNAIQHIGSVEFIKKWVEWKVSISATSDGKLNVSWDNLIFTNSSNNSISSSEQSYILWWSSNKIETSTGSTIIAWNANEIKDAELSVIGWGQRNTVKGNYSVIAGWFDNSIAQDSSYSSILWWAGNALKWNYSSIVWNNNSLIGNNSVIFGSRWNLNANSSFLWSDGKGNNSLNESNVFAVLSENGMVINSNQANSNAQLTIWWSLRIAENVEKDNQVECQNGKWKWILKVMPKNDGSNQKCFCSCNGNSWDSMFGDGRCEWVCKWGLEPICGTTVSSKKVGEDFYMSGSCNQWKVVEWSGSYYVSNNWKNNKSTLHWTCQTDDWQTKACSGDIVGYDYKPVPECKNLPANAVPNNEKIPSYNMNYRYSMNVDVVCSFKCKAGYRWNQSKQICESTTTTFQCIWTEPSNATLVAWSDQNLTANTTRTLYANAAAANWKKCAYLCNSDTKYDSVLKMCINKSSYCKATHYECESPAVATNKKATSTEYTWDCAINGTTVSAWCSEVIGGSCNHCAKNWFPYCFPINFDLNCDESKY